MHNFTVDDLFHLYRGGRVSKTAAVVGSMINLKPILHVDNEGHLIPLSKVRGRKKSLIALVDSMEKQIGAWRDKNDIVFISHGDSLEDAHLSLATHSGILSSYRSSAPSCTASSVLRMLLYQLHSQFRSFGVVFQPRTFSAQDLSTCLLYTSRCV